MGRAGIRENTPTPQHPISSHCKKSLPSENANLSIETEKMMNLIQKGIEPPKSATEYAKTRQNIPLENGEKPVTIEQRAEMMTAMRKFLGGKFSNRSKLEQLNPIGTIL